MNVVRKINGTHSTEKAERREAKKLTKKSVAFSEEPLRNAGILGGGDVLRAAKALTPALSITVRQKGLSLEPILLFHKNGLKIDNKRIQWEKRSYSLAKISTVYVASVFTGSIYRDLETYLLAMETHNKRALPDGQNFTFIQNADQALLMEASRVLTATTSGSNQRSG